MLFCNIVTLYCTSDRAGGNVVATIQWCVINILAHTIGAAVCSLGG